MRFEFSRTLKVVVFLIGAVFALSALAASGQSAKDELRIGLITALTGPVATQGIPQHDAVAYMAKQANEHGGINGREVIVFSEDGKSDPTEITKAARKMMLEHNVDVIIGPSMGRGALAVGQRLAARHKVPVVAPVGTISVTAKDSGFFGWMFRSSRNARTELIGTFKRMKSQSYKRIGLFFQHDAYGKTGAKSLKISSKRRLT